MPKPKVCLLMTTDGNVKDILPKDGKTFKLKELQEIVGGNVELVSLPNGMELWLNEEGKLDGLPMNYTATDLWRTVFKGYQIGADDFVVGDVIYCDKGFVK